MRLAVIKNIMIRGEVKRPNRFIRWINKKLFNKEYPIRKFIDIRMQSIDGRQPDINTVISILLKSKDMIDCLVISNDRGFHFIVSTIIPVTETYYDILLEKNRGLSSVNPVSYIEQYKAFVECSIK